MSDGFVSGHCSACKQNAERGPSGAWWHLDNADACPRRGPDGPAVFRIAI